jgi:hypothetical protein
MGQSDQRGEVYYILLLYRGGEMCQGKKIVDMYIKLIDDPV